MTAALRRGGCLCGAVRFEAREVPDTVGICHCEMCRRWTGSSLIEVSLPERNVTWSGAEHIATRATSAWAERAWCRECGSCLYFKVTQAGEWAGGLDMPLGIFDDPDGFAITHEIYVDFKSDSYAYAGEAGRRRLTRADCVARFPALAEDGS